MKKLYWIILLIPILSFSCLNNDEDADEYMNILDISTKAIWKSTPNETVIVIHTQDEMDEYYTDIDESKPLEIDFNTKTVLMVSGVTTNGIANKTLKLKHIKANTFLMEAVIELDDTTIAQGYQWVVEVPKLPKDAQVSFSVTYKK